MMSMSQSVCEAGTIGTDPAAARLIAFYLPQFHPIPENDAWWGTGFTEWTNVAKAQPLFAGHYQPRLPADLGFYDLRVPETRAAQAALARKYGIGGFCYWHYWFHGRRLLERPFQEVLDSGEPDFPFCLAWANENWSRRWDGAEHEVLMPQSYSREDDRAHLRALVPALADERYVRVEGKPLLIVYRLVELPEPQRTAEIWRDEARRAGLGDLHLCYLESGSGLGRPPADFGFDAAIEFAPEWRGLGPLPRPTLWSRLQHRLQGRTCVEWRHEVRDYAELVRVNLAKPAPGYVRYPCVTPDWDNSARRASGGRILKGSTPERYEQWLSAVLASRLPEGAEHRLCFINAWNEWAEGNHLEPCQRWGHAYLQATARALETARARSR